LKRANSEKETHTSEFSQLVGGPRNIKIFHLCTQFGKTRFGIIFFLFVVVFRIRSDRTRWYKLILFLLLLICGISTGTLGWATLFSCFRSALGTFALSQDIVHQKSKKFQLMWYNSATKNV